MGAGEGVADIGFLDLTVDEAAVDLLDLPCDLGVGVDLTGHRLGILITEAAEDEPRAAVGEHALGELFVLFLELRQMLVGQCEGNTKFT